jgi:ElaB/YqjD/DUF883 family membrane-anchored ribosome-binding protein
MDVPRMDRSLGELFSDLSQQTAELIKQEMRLAKAELSAKAADVGKHATMIGAGVAFALAAVVMFAATIALLHRLHARAVGHCRVEEEINRTRRNDAFPQGDDPVAQERNEMTSNETADTAEIKSEIARTRVEMSETLGEIQERLRPDHLIQQAKDTVTDAATGKVRNIMHSAGETATIVADQTRYASRSVADYVRMHPVQMALIAGGITWWLLRSRNTSDDWMGASEGWQDGQGYDEGFSAGYSTSEETGRPLTEKVGEVASNAGAAVSEYATSAASRARYAGRRVATATTNAASSARYGIRRAGTQADQWVHEYPLAAGAIAVAIGAAIGLSAPATEWEDRTLGDKRDLAMERAREAARELRENVTQKVQNVADTVVETANSISSATTPPPSSSTSSTSTTGSV